MSTELFGTTTPSPLPVDGPQIAGLTVTEDDYFLPEGGMAAQKRFLDILASFTEVWISAYGFTLQPMFTELKAADARGAKIHILLDHSQETGNAEAPEVLDLIKSLKNGDVTVTTAGVNSAQKSDIWHWKAMVIDTNAPNESSGDELLCWEGSTNFSAGAWYQGNSARVFRSDKWGQTFRDQFETHKSWALQNEPQYQPK